jgi:hypothetical protein
MIRCVDPVRWKEALSSPQTAFVGFFGEEFEQTTLPVAPEE